MNFLKNPKFWILIGALVLVVLALVAVNLMGSETDQEDKTETTVPAVSDQTTTATNSALPESVSINAVKLANNYFVFERSEFEKAKAANRPILLFFYANWCPTCARQEPVNVDTFNSLNNSNVIGFRVNYNDPDTSDDEEALAKEFGVRYQHTFFTLDKSGKQVDRFLGDTSEQKIKEFLAKIE
jgi:thioredoxin-like negative regulator of GroEL